MFGTWLLYITPHRLWFSAAANNCSVAIRRSSASARFAVGFAVALLGILTRVLFIPYWGIGVPLVTFYPAVLLASILGGFAAGISTTLILAIAAAYLFFQPVRSFAIGNSSEGFTLLLFVMLGCVISFFVEMLIRTQETLVSTSQKAHEAQLDAELANQAKDKFLAMVSHELRSPMHAILGSVQILRNKSKLPPEIEPLVAMIERNAKTEARLVQDLLDLSRISCGKMELNCEPTSARAIIETVLECMQPAFEEKHLMASLEKQGPERSILVDPPRLQQIVTNLFSNAVKFTDPGGWIKVCLNERDSTETLLSVSDSGIGIDEGLKEHLFKPFRQGDTRQRHAGLGLGLSIVKSLVELHGGSIQAQSAGLGKGSTFIVRLPNSPLGEKCGNADIANRVVAGGDYTG